MSLVLDEVTESLSVLEQYDAAAGCAGRVEESTFVLTMLSSIEATCRTAIGDDDAGRLASAVLDALNANDTPLIVWRRKDPRP